MPSGQTESNILPTGTRALEKQLGASAVKLQTSCSFTTTMRRHTSFAVREFLAQNKITTLPHPPYNPDLAPYDFFLFPKLKTHLKGHHFGTVENVQAAATRALNISSEFLHCYEEWQQRWNRCIRSQGAYLEGDKL